MKKKFFFEITKVLKAMVLPSSVRRRISQTFKTFWILVILARKFFSFCFFLLYEKWIPVIFMVSLHKLIHFMPQTASFTLFSTPIPAILHFSWSGFKPGYFENVANVLRSSLIDHLPIKKKSSIVCINWIQMSVLKDIDSFHSLITFDYTKYNFKT